MTNSHHRLADLMLLLAILLILIIVLLTTPLGTKTIASLVNTARIGLQLEDVGGTILGGLEVGKLTWEKGKSHIELTHIKLKPAAKPYHNKRFNLERLTAGTLTIYLSGRGNRPDRTTNNVRIPDIPFPVDLYADRVSLQRLDIYSKPKQRILFSIEDMRAEQTEITNSLLHTATLTGKPVVAGYPLGIWLNNASLDFMQPHSVAGKGRVKYAHIYTGQFTGRVKLSGTLTDYQGELDLLWKERALGRSQIKSTIKGDYDKAKFLPLTLENPGANLTATGFINWFSRFSWDAEIEGKDIRFEEFTQALPSELQANLHTTGSWSYDSKQWEVRGDFSDINGEFAGFPVNGNGTVGLKDSLLTVHNIAARSGENRVRLDGQITEPAWFDWDVEARDISQLLPQYTGSIVGKGRLEGTTIAPRGKGHLSLRRVKAEGVEVTYAEVDFTADKASQLLSGQIDADIKQLKYQDMQVEKLNLVFDGKGESESAILGKGTLQVEQFQHPRLSLGKADIRFDGSSNNLNIDGTLKDMETSGQKINEAHLDGKGRIDKHLLALKAKSPLGRLDMQARGSWINNNWQGQVSKLEVRETATGDWLLAKPSSLDVSKDQFLGSEICIRNPVRGESCTQVSWQRDAGVKAKGSLKAVPLAQLKPWLPENIDLPGSASAVFDLQQSPNGLNGDAHITLPDSSIVFTRQDGGKDRFTYQSGKIDLDFADRQLKNKASLIFAGRGKLLSEGTIKVHDNPARSRIQNTLNFEIENLAWLQEFVPDIVGLQGSLSSRVQLKGSLAKPEFGGELKLQNAAFRLPDTNTSLSNIDLQVKAVSGNKASILGSLMAGQGKMDIDGTFTLKSVKDWIAEVQMNGNDLQFMNTHEVQAYASPKLNLIATPGVVKINGQLHIPRARLQFDELPEGTVNESEDVILVGQQQKDAEGNGQKRSQVRVLPNVKVTLGSPVTFDGFGLHAQLEGNLDITHNRGTVLSRGTLRVKNGQYRAYGQRLTIEHGVLVFNGPIDSPGLDIRATRQVDDITAGLNLAGTLQAPESSIFSDPPQPESDALSYLLTGQSLSETTGDEAQLLVQAVRTLGINSGSNLLNRMGGSVGLDDVNIITYGDYKQNKLQLGKRLGPNLYVKYITGLFDSFHKIAVDYKISNKWTLEAESGEEQGIDFIYEIDRD